MLEKQEIYQGDIYCRVVGEGPSVVLLHGFGEDGNAWNELLPYLKGPYRLLIPDIPGSGRSPLHPDSSINPSIDILADMLMELFPPEKNNRGKVILAGHSMGGYLALSIAARFPERIAGLALVHSTAYADSEEKKAGRSKSIAFIQEHGSKKYLQQSIPGLFGSRYKTSHATAYQHWVDQYANAFPDEILIHYLTAMRDRPDRSETMKNLMVPLALVIGEEDQAVSLAHSLEQARMAKEPVICQMEKIGHMGMIEAPDSVGLFLHEYFQDICKNPEMQL